MHATPQAMCIANSNNNKNENDDKNDDDNHSGSRGAAKQP